MLFCMADVDFDNPLYASCDVKRQLLLLSSSLLRCSMWSSFTEHHKRWSVHHRRSVGKTRCLAVAGHA